MADDHGHRFAVYSATGVHVGVWDDGLTAAKVLNDYPGGRVEELVTLSRAKAMVAEEREACASVAESPNTPLFKNSWTAPQDAAAIHAMLSIAKAIRARTPAKDQTALDALLGTSGGCAEGCSKETDQ